MPILLGVTGTAWDIGGLLGVCQPGLLCHRDDTAGIVSNDVDRSLLRPNHPAAIDRFSDVPERFADTTLAISEAL